MVGLSRHHQFPPAPAGCSRARPCGGLRHFWGSGLGGSYANRRSQRGVVSLSHAVASLEAEKSSALASPDRSAPPASGTPCSLSRLLVRLEDGSVRMPESRWLSIPQRDDAPLGMPWIMLENAQRSGAEREKLAIDNGQPNPSHGQHAREVTVREERDVAVKRIKACN
jgi:hypothetical protein